MNRYRLTFDANPKELARRDSAGTHVALLWSRRCHRAAVVLEDDASGGLVELDIRERENPLALYQHPYAYLGTRGRPGRYHATPSLAQTQTRATRAAREVSTMEKKDKREIKKDSRMDERKY